MNNSSKRSTESAILIFSLVLLFVVSRVTWNVMAWDGFAQQTRKYRSIHPMEYPKFQTRIFGRMENAHSFRTYMYPIDVYDFKTQMFYCQFVKSWN